ncbi:nitrate reductase molybdenum cofactor assembly chaperone [Microbacterium sp. KR10-403]|uniref:nitrate reductase molybdenum cofactor assembly chaperone n=1 Tax=Microbacterium sp. KR10-403 TaxID=3158581 RepID=UPI0032E39157
MRALIDPVPAEVRTPLLQFIDVAEASDDLGRLYVNTFDLKRKCSLYLTYYANGDTRKRGTALVTILEAYRAAGWEFDAQELPDYLPAVLEFSAMSDSEIAAALLSSHREGVEVLRAALEGMDSPWAGVVRAVTLSLPPIDAATRERYLDLINEGPPTETVGLSFLGNLPPFQVREDA